MKRRLSPNEAAIVDSADGTLSLGPDRVAAASSEHLTELIRSVLSREFLSNLLSESAASTPIATAAKRFGNIAFGASDESNVNAFLHQKLGRDNLSRRAGPGGKRLTYIESCKAIELANQAFGFNGWSCHILDCKEEYREKKNERWSIGFSSLVRIELKDGTSHEDFGFGQADGQPHLGAAIEQAKKASISDARKRALRLFGEYLGNSCYDREHIRDVQWNKPPTAVPTRTSTPGITASGSTPSPAMALPTAIAHSPPIQTTTPQPPRHAAAVPGLVHAPAASAAIAPILQNQPNASVAHRISALQVAEMSRQASVRHNGVGAAQGVGIVGGAVPPAQDQRMATSAPPSALARASATPINPLNAVQHHRTVQHQSFVARNAPPPSRLNAYVDVKTDLSPGLTSEYDINDLSLSQFDYDPNDEGKPGAAKRMRA